MEVGVVRRIDIDTEMQQAYLDYAMSVIVARAIPDARDGLKPVHRRILYAMYDMNLRPDTAYKKSARIVGEVLGKYHPHGDAAVYEAMARMAQDFSMRYLLVDGQGNFGSVDGDAPAAMRYTEARLGRMAMDLLADIQKDTVEFGPNFDDTLTEPAVLPAAAPNLLINGASGIAVGMATSIPPHNLGEVCDALIFMLERWNKLDDVTVDDLMRFIKGPDFPTGGVIISPKKEDEGLSAAYGTGRGKVTVQAKAHVEDIGRGRSRVIVTELPYQTNKSALIERIADLARDGAVEGIADLRDESNRQGMRIVIEVAKTGDPQKIIADLFKRTPMQGTFSINMLALVNGEPRTLTLKQALRVYLDHRLEVVRRRSEYDLARARERAHILEGLLTALKHLDEVIRLIRHSKDADEARSKLTKRFKLSEAQATAILDMALRRLAALERQKIEEEYKEKKALIKRLESLLGSPKLMRERIQEELRQIKRQYGDPRRTQVVEAGEGPVLTAADLIPSEKTWVTVTQAGTISRTPAGKMPKASAGAAPLAVLGATTKDTLYLVTLKGRAASLPVYALPEREDPADGAPWSSVSALDAASRVAAAVAVPPLPDAASGEDGVEPGYLFLATQAGRVKRIALSDLPGPSAQVYNVMNVAEGDGVAAARLTSGKDEVLLASSLGQSIRFRESEVSSQGLSAAGVRGIRLSVRDDRIVGLDVMRPRADVYLAADNGQAKRTSPAEFPTQGRDGVGVSAWKLPAKTRLVGACTGYADSRVAFVTARGAAKVEKFDRAPRRGRAARGGTVVKLKDRDAVIRLAPYVAVFSLHEPEGPAPKKRARRPTAERRARGGRASSKRAAATRKSG